MRRHEMGPYYRDWVLGVVRDHGRGLDLHLGAVAARGTMVFVAGAVDWIGLTPMAASRSAIGNRRHARAFVRSY